MRLFFILFAFCSIINLSYGQATFVSPDTVCVNEQFNVQNFSTGLGLDYSWNFCRPSVNNTGTGVNTGNPSGMLSVNVFCDIVEDAGNYYMFVTNYSSRNIVRLDYGTSPLNVPVGTNLGNFGNVIPPQTEGIQIRKDGGNWYGFVVGGNGSGNARLVRLDFGTSLTNVPVVTNLGNVGNMDWSTEYQLVKDGANWFGLVANRSNSRISIHNFGNSLTNIPLGSSFQVTTASGTCNLMAVKDGVNWHVFVTAMFGGQSLIRLDYGNSLTNIPTETNLGNFGGNLTSLPRGIIILKDCDEYVGYLGHEGGRTLKLNFPTGLTGVPVVTNLNNISGVYGKVHNFTPITHAGELYLFTCDYQSNTITRLDINLCAGTLPSSDAANLPPLSYGVSGNYDITLLLDVGRGTQDAYCKDIDVLPAIPYHLGNDTSICEHIGNLVLDAGPGYAPYTWSTGQNTQQIQVNLPGKYYVDGIDPVTGCPITDTIQVTFLSPNVDLGPDIQQCDGVQKAMLDAGIANSYVWSTGETSQVIAANNTGWYWVDVTDGNNCIGRDSLLVDYWPIPNIVMPSDTTVDCGQEFTLNLNGNINYNYTWQDGSILPSHTVNEKGVYSVYVTNQYNCSNFYTTNVKFKGCEIFYPNAFTPGNDNINDVVQPIYLSRPDVFNIQIFNRWGDLIYETDEIDDFWDGKIKGSRVQTGVYVYKLKYKYEGESLEEKYGHLNILP